MPNAARCGGDFRFAPCVAGTCGSPTHASSLFCDTIQFAIETDRSCHRQGPGAEWRSGLFSLPQICSAPSEIQTDRPSHRLPQNSPSRIRAAERHSATIHFSLFSIHLSRPGLPLPLPGSARELLSRGRRISSPAAMRDCKTPFPPRTAPHAGHRLILNPCRRAALQNYSLFSILSSLSQPCPFFPPGRTAKQKYILFFGHLTHNSARYNVGLNLIMEGKEYGKTGSA